MEDRVSSDNPRKRVKIEEPDEEPFQDHPTLYIDDGNIILRTRSTLFCVHRSILSMHSSVFRELFQTDRGRFRGLAHYTMKETREDLEVLLNVIYDGLHVDVEDLTVETFPFLATVLRMGTKYRIERPCQEIVARIRKQWPATLAEHDAQVAQLRVPVPHRFAANDKGKAPDAKPPHAHANGHAQHFGAPAFYAQHPGQPSLLPLQAAAQQQQQMANAWMYGPRMNVPPAPPGAHADPNDEDNLDELVEVLATINVDLALLQNVMVHDARPSNANAALPPPMPAPAPPGGGGAAAAAAKEDLIIHPASVIAVLRECGYRDAALFFPLFYALSRTTAQFGGGALGHHLAPLSAADMERFVVGIECMRAHHTSLAVSTPVFDRPLQGAGPAHAAGGLPHFCRAGAQQLWASIVFTLLVASKQHPREPVEQWQDIVVCVKAQYGRYQICTECCKAIVAKIQAYRASLWASLPRFFELA